MDVYAAGMNFNRPDANAYIAALLGRMPANSIGSIGGIGTVPSATVYAPAKNNAPHSSTDATGSPPTDKPRYVTRLGEHDIVCGRGSGANDNPGNRTFRRVILSRKMDYMATPSRKEKSRIAQQVVRYIRTEMSPPGNFLMKLEAEDAKERGFPYGMDVWVEVDDTMALEKTKQALRRGATLKDLGGKGTGDGDGERSKDEDNESEVGGKNDAPTARGSPSPATSAGHIGPALSAAAARASPAGADTISAVAPASVQDTTLSDWIKSERRATRDLHVRKEKLEAWVHLARQIANAFEERRHGANSAARCGRGISVDDIRLSQEVGEERKVRIVTPSVGDAPNPASMQADLVSLGRVLYELFAGVPPSFGGAVTTSLRPALSSRMEDVSIGDGIPAGKRERRAGGAGYVPLRDLSLPVSLSILVSSLLDAEDESAADRFHEIGEVVKDLSLMEADPGRHLFDKASVAQLDAPADKLYGREGQLAKLMGVYGRVIGSGGSCEVALFAGYSGTGKTSLANQARDRIEKAGGYFVSGKFDSLHQAQPLSAIVAAFDGYCSELLGRDENETAQVRAAIKDAIGSGGSVLADLIPNLRHVIGESGLTTAQVNDGKGALNRLIFFFRKFVQAVSSPSHPVILFLDDLQWADQASLELIQMLVTDQDVKSLLFLGCYRSNEVNSDHQLTTVVKKIMASGVYAETIEVPNMDFESVNAFLSDRLHLSPRVTTSLANTVYSKTNGNPLFLIQFLGSLLDEGLIRYSSSSRRWEWDVEAIKMKDIADNCVDLMTRKMLGLPPAVQFLLMIASFLGCQCEEAILKLLCQDRNNEHTNPGHLLDIAEGHGLVFKTGSSYKFSHDQIQQAAYSLVPKSDQVALHLKIGRLLWNQTSETEMENRIFVIVDQLSLGKELISDHSEKVQVACLCLRAGEKAMSSSAFSSASVYLNMGKGLLEEGDWENHYETCIRLYSASAEAEYVCGNFEGTRVAVDKILSRARSFDDKLRAHHTLVISLGAQGNLDAAIKAGMDVLSHFGVCFPDLIDEAVVGAAVIETTQLLAAMPESEILGLKKLEAKNIEVAMRVLTLMTTFAYFGRQELFPLITNHMVKLSISHGVCSESALAFSSFAMVLVGILGDPKGGCRYGKLAIKVLDQFDSKHVTARLYGAIFGGINHWCEPLQVGLPTSLLAYEIGMGCGDVYFAMLNLHNYFINSFQSGSTLEPLAEEMKRSSRKMLDYKQDLMHLLMQPVRQATLNLLGKSADPTMLTGEAMDQDTYLWEALDKQNLSAACLTYTIRLWLAYLFRDYEVAAEMADKSGDVEKLCSCQFIVCNQKFYEGLAALALARATPNAKWLDIAGRAIKKMSSWADNVPWNCQHKLELLNAELSFTAGNADEAVRLYGCAADNAHKHGFVNEEALIYERAGLFYSERGDHFSAVKFYEKSHQAYLKWGARRKADDILKLSRVT